MLEIVATVTSTKCLPAYLKIFETAAAEEREASGTPGTRKFRETLKRTPARTGGSSTVDLIFDELLGNPFARRLFAAAAAPPSTPSKRANPFAEDQAPMPPGPFPIAPFVVCYDNPGDIDGHTGIVYSGSEALVYGAPDAAVIWANLFAAIRKEADADLSLGQCAALAGVPAGFVCRFAFAAHLLDDSPELAAAYQRAARVGPLRTLAAARPYAANVMAYFNSLD
ncbi:hypothetical protein HRG_000337 [Hirsutella rhossiliensis]|uniref:Uncharacterized protein n=1 Tax=Hirsutella rhossiliensis TaxID=111463 RepID=A0A9P8N682_9HYPO|nr:uncharacterized protein HRG_00337 [Hirsutella rhossiliensis]KAH0967695.1 hypothetical protein HRG_00337 [Hirsutella rhossiliensis]